MGSPDRAEFAAWRRPRGTLLSLVTATTLLIAAITALALVPPRLRERVETARSELDEDLGSARGLSVELRAALDREAAAASGYLLDRDVSNKVWYRRARATEDSALMQLAPLARRMGSSVVAALSDVRNRAAAWHAPQERLLLDEPGYAPEFLSQLPAVQAMYGEVRLAAERLEDAVAQAEAVRLARVDELREMERRAASALVWLAALAALIVLGLGFRLIAVAGRPPKKRLEESERRFGLLAASSREVFWIRDGETGRFVYVSPAYESVWGRSREPLYAGFGPFLATVHPEDRRRVEAASSGQRTATSSGQRTATGSGEREADELEYRIVRPDGAIRWIAERSLPMRDETGRSTRLLGIAADVTERFEAREHLAHLALHDPLTGLGNHLLFFDRMEHAVARSRRSGAALAVVIVDLKSFGSVNKTLGRPTADRVLVAVARRLTGTVRAEDTVVRLGEDAFAVLLERVEGRGDVVRAAKRITSAFETPFLANGADVELGAHIAIAVSGAGQVTPADIGRLADAALGRVRLGSGAPFEIVERGGPRPAADSEARDDAGRSGEAGRSRDAGRSGLRQALRDGEFRVAYQPVLELETEAFVGLEALVRWEHPEHGTLLPGEFLPLAEESGFIHALGRWVLSEVTSDLRTWDSGPLAHVWVSINLSLTQFELPEFVDEVARAIDGAGVLPSRLRVEVDETAWFRAREALRRLQELGVGIVVDGFGERYGALGALRRLPVDGIKLNRRLGFGLADAGGVPSTVASLAGLAGGLGLEVMAVGVESAREAKALRACGCDAGQGYHFARPLRGEELPGWLAGGAPRRKTAFLS